MNDAIDTANHFAVGVNGDKLVILRPILGPLTKDEALNLAAWLVALCNVNNRDFLEKLDAIEAL